MEKGNKDMNRLWWMASAVVLLFVALAVGPVAANYNVTPYPFNNHTYIPMANPPIRFDSTYLGDPYYYVNLTKPTGGLNALHITNNTADFKGFCDQTNALSGTFYVSDTGGKGGEDDIVLLIAVNSTFPTDISNFSINIKERGYYWIPTSTGSPNQTVVYKDPSIDVTLNADNYLENNSVDLFQKWKFAPTANYPVYCGQAMGSDSPLFKFIVVDNKIGTINGTWYNAKYDPDLSYNNGMTKIEYNILSAPSANVTIAFNVYAANNQTSLGKESLAPGINWLNMVYSYDQRTDGLIMPNSSGWLVIPPSE